MNGYYADISVLRPAYPNNRNLRFATIQRKRRMSALPMQREVLTGTLRNNRAFGIVLATSKPEQRPYS